MKEITLLNFWILQLVLIVVSVFRKSTFSGMFSLILKAFYLLITSFAFLTYYFTDASLFVLQVKNNLRLCNHKICISREGISSIICSQMYKILFKMSFFVLETVLQTLLVLPFLGLLYFQHRTGLQKCFKSLIPNYLLKIFYQSVK